MDTQDISVVVKQVETDLLKEITDNLKRNETDPQKAQALAKEFLSYLPQQDFAGLLAVLKNLSGKYPEARDVLIKYKAIDAKMSDEKKASILASHISSGNIDKAIEIAKGGGNA